MPQTRKKVTDGLRAALAHGTTGLNVKFAAVAPTYGITPLSTVLIHWDPMSRQVFEGFITPEQIEISQIAEYPAIILYTSVSANELGTMPTKFSGMITAHADIILRFDVRQGTGGVEVDNTEPWANAVEDAVIEAIHGYDAWPSGVTPHREFRCERDPVTLLGDGWQQRLPFTFPFEVTAT